MQETRHYIGSGSKQESDKGWGRQGFRLKDWSFAMAAAVLFRFSEASFARRDSSVCGSAGGLGVEDDEDAVEEGGRKRVAGRGTPERIGRPRADGFEGAGRADERVLV